MLHVLLLLACAVTIYFACEWFINAVEWLGVELKVGPLAVGTVLAAAGTALPESIVTLVAALFGGAGQGNDIAVGAGRVWSHGWIQPGAAVAKGEALPPRRS